MIRPSIGESKAVKYLQGIYDCIINVICTSRSIREINKLNNVALFFIPLGFFKSLPNLEAYSELVL